MPALCERIACHPCLIIYQGDGFEIIGSNRGVLNEEMIDKIDILEVLVVGTKTLSIASRV